MILQRQVVSRVNSEKYYLPDFAGTVLHAQAWLNLFMVIAVKISMCQLIFSSLRIFFRLFS